MTSTSAQNNFYTCERSDHARSIKAGEGRFCEDSLAFVDARCTAAMGVVYINMDGRRASDSVLELDDASCLSLPCVGCTDGHHKLYWGAAMSKL